MERAVDFADENINSIYKVDIIAVRRVNKNNRVTYFC